MYAPTLKMIGEECQTAKISVESISTSNFPGPSTVGLLVSEALCLQSDLPEYTEANYYQ